MTISGVLQMTSANYLTNEMSNFASELAWRSIKASSANKQLKPSTAKPSRSKTQRKVLILLLSPRKEGQTVKQSKHSNTIHN